MQDDLISAYKNTYYRVDGFNDPIQIDVVSVEANNLLRSRNLSSWAYITAYNPLSVILDEKSNIRRNNELREFLKEFYVIDGYGQDKDMQWPAENSFFIAGISLSKAKVLASRFGQRAIVFGLIDQPAQLILTLDFVGNSNIIKQCKTAFLCSRKIPASAVLKCYDWALEQRDLGNCVISGFHSQIEKDVLHYLLKGNQPIIIALARGLKEKIEPEFVKPLEQGRLLIITAFDKSVNRVSSQNAQTRNQLMKDLADHITIGYASPGGQLSKILREVDKPLTTIFDPTQFS